ncbi:MAG: lipase family protein [Gordonia sp. (in: high G+C Gram-positive bacteria)]
MSATRGRRSVRSLLTVMCACAAVLAVAPTAAAQPGRPESPRLAPLPGPIVDGVDRVVPPAKIPSLKTIPARSAAPGVDHALLELRDAVLPSPIGDPMFDEWPAGLAERKPGDVLSVRTITRSAQPVVMVPITRARMVKFRSTDTLGEPIFGTATVIEPAIAWNGPGPRPILVNNLPINGLGVKCTSAYTLLHGINDKTNQTDLFPPTTQWALSRGYTVIVPDHEGPRMAYAEPVVAGHIVLDAVRAAAELSPEDFGKSRVAVTGYSGGAIATNGTSKVLGSYAPELMPRMAGAAFGGVPADYHMMVDAMNQNVATGIMLAATLGVARERPDILSMANNLGKQVATSELKDSCGSNYGMAAPLQLPAQILSSDRDPFHSKIAETVYKDTEMADVKAALPIFIYQGAQEIWVPAQGARNLYAQQCKLGANARYDEVLGEHLSAAMVAYPAVLDWLDQRLRGIPAGSGCGT